MSKTDSVLNEELRIMRSAAKMFGSLPEEARYRVINWLSGTTLAPSNTARETRQADLFGDGGKP